MKLETLRNQWQAKNPTGQIWYTDESGTLSDSPIGKSKKFAVNYKTDGKLYTYTASSVYKLAERFDLIPNCPDMWIEAQKAIDILDSGNVYTSPFGVFDTVRFLLNKKFGTDKFILVSSEYVGKDEFDRDLYSISGYTVYNNYAEYEQVRYSK